jgi:hypothetical protein
MVESILINYKNIFNTMKRIFFYITGFILISFLLVNCKKSDNVGIPPQNVQNITGIAGYGEADFAWTLPSDSSYLYVSISYTDSTGKAVEQKFSRYTTGAAIGGLLPKPYTFTVKTVKDNGAVSSAQTFTVTPNLPAYTIVAQSVSISPDFGAAQINWANVTGKTLGVKIQYQDNTGTTQIYAASTSSALDSSLINKLNATPTNLTITFSDSSGKSSSPVTLSTTPYKEVQFPNSQFSIAGFDSQETSGEPAPNGFATAAIDSNIATYWHTSWSASLPPFPHWIAINLGGPKVVSRVVIYTRQGNKNGMTSFQILGSNDNVNWTLAGTYTFDPTIFTGQSFALSKSARSMKYLKIYATAGKQTYMFLGEVYAYGAG